MPPARAGTGSRGTWWAIGGVVTAVILIVGLVVVLGHSTSTSPLHDAVVPTYGSTSVPAGTRGVGWYWGANTVGPAELAVVSPGKFPTVVTANGYFVGLDTHGDAWTWGSLTGVESPSELTSSQSPVPVAVPAGVRFTSVSTDNGYVLAVDRSGRLWAWGNNAEGELGTGSTATSLSPLQVHTPPGVTYRAVSAGRFFALALDSQGHVGVWGANNDGDLGNGSAADISQPPMVDDITTPVEVAAPAGVVFRSVAAGETNAAALDTSGHAWTW